MNQCFYCEHGKVTTPPNVKSFEEFVDTTSVACKLGKKTGCDYCKSYGDKDDAKHKTNKEAS